MKTICMKDTFAANLKSFGKSLMLQFNFRFHAGYAS